MDDTGSGLPNPARHGQNERATTITRKNALFAGSDGGGHRWAVLCSLIETCKLNGVEPYAYLHDVLSRIIDRGGPGQLSECGRRGGRLCLESPILFLRRARAAPLASGRGSGEKRLDQKEKCAERSRSPLASLQEAMRRAHHVMHKHAILRQGHQPAKKSIQDRCQFGTRCDSHNAKTAIRTSNRV
jgi:hypothetical protein